MVDTPIEHSSRHASGRLTSVRLGVSSLSRTPSPKGDKKMTSESPEKDTNETRSRNSSTQYRQNQRMLDLRQKVELQERIIRYLLAEKDNLTKELDSRLFLVEAQLRHEQKHIEEELDRKEQLIQFQAMQINSLKQLLTQSTRDYRSYKRRSMSKRYSMALDECMKDHCVVSRALPVMVQAENEKQDGCHRVCSRTRSLPELRFRDIESERTGCLYNFYEQMNPPPGLFQSSKNLFLENARNRCSHFLTKEVLDEITNHRWSSDCDSEHSDSLDSGISSPSIQTKSMHEYFESNLPPNVHLVNHENLRSSTRSRMDSSIKQNQTLQRKTTNDVFKDNTHKPRRSSSIGSFIQRTFSSSEKTNGDADNRRHSYALPAERKCSTMTNGYSQHKDTFISSANRTFGTNHRSVMKPRDVKFKKLFKFKRRAEESEVPPEENYMTV